MVDEERGGRGRIRGQGGPAVPSWTLGDRMRKSLEAAGMGVQEVADELGVSRAAVGKWLHGHVTPRRPVLIAWAGVTGVPLHWLETGDEGEAAGEPPAAALGGAPRPTEPLAGAVPGL